MLKFYHAATITSTILLSGSLYAIAPQSNTQNPPLNYQQPITSINETIKRININNADTETLQKIKGFGKKKAEMIIEYRQKNGSFKTIDDLLKVKARGLNQKWLEKIRPSLSLQ